VTLDCAGKDPFAPLKAVPGVDGESASIVEACDLCTMLRADRTGIQRKFILHRFKALNGYIDGGKRGYYNFGALSSGYDYSCHSSGEDRAYVKGCAIAYELATHCPERSFADLIEFLDESHLLSFLVSQDVFMYRKSLNSELKVHPKLLSLPLGVDFRQYQNWAKGGTYFEYLVELIVDDRWVRDHLMIARDSQAYQRQAVHAQLSGMFGHEFEAANNKDKPRNFYIKDLAEAKFIVSPPGWGSDCYRHWEALLLGTLPLVKETSISVGGGLAFTPAVVYDDYSMVNKAELEKVWQQTSSTSPNRLFDAAAPAYQEFWVKLLVNVLTGHAANPIAGAKLGAATLRFKFSGRKCGVHTFDAVAASLEHQTSKYPFLKLAANVLNSRENTTREYCECPCQCGLCASNALERDWKQLEDVEGFGKAADRNPNMITNAYAGRGPKRGGAMGAGGGDAYHAFRCAVVPQDKRVAEGPCSTV
jgi:hypothetical protein